MAKLISLTHLQRTEKKSKAHAWPQTCVYEGTTHAPELTACAVAGQHRPGKDALIKQHPSAG